MCAKKGGRRKKEGRKEGNKEGRKKGGRKELTFKKQRRYLTLTQDVFTNPCKSRYLQMSMQNILFLPQNFSFPRAVALLVFITFPSHPSPALVLAFPF